jgi:hypothetical protein
MKWNSPKEVTHLNQAFPGRIIGVLLPEKEEIPEEFKNSFSADSPSVSSSPPTPREWCSFVGHWFFHGIRGFTIQPKKGIALPQALKHLTACMTSFEPKHEHKEAGVAYLCSLWLDGFEKKEE